MRTYSTSVFCLLWACSAISNLCLLPSIGNAFSITPRKTNGQDFCRQHFYTTTSYDASPGRVFLNSATLPPPPPMQQPTMVLLASPQNDNSHNDNDDDDNNTSSLSRWDRVTRRGGIRKRLGQFVKTMFLTSTVFLARGPKPAEAKFAYEIRDERKYSIRPGATQEQAQQLVEGQVPEDIPETKSVFNVAGTTMDTNRDESSSSSSSSSSKQKSTSTFDYGNEDDGDDDFSEFQDVTKSSSSARSLSSSSSKKKVLATRAEKKSAERLKASTRSQFTGIDPSRTKSRALYLKVSVGLFIPTWGAMGAREFVRRRKEEAYVKKGLEILAAQKAEYFNVTETTPDSDIEDELKDLKDDEDDDDDDDEEDDDDDDSDDDDDDDDEPDTPPPSSSSRKGPKRPSGGGGNKDGSGGSGGDPGYGKPSDDDLKRLGDLFNKS